MPFQKPIKLSTLVGQSITIVRFKITEGTYQGKPTISALILRGKDASGAFLPSATTSSKNVIQQLRELESNGIKLPVTRKVTATPVAEGLNDKLSLE